MTQEELNEVLRLHKQWLETKGNEGKRADLQGADLRGADLSGANLKGADLQGANMNGADLSGANLKGADLSGAYLHRADLSDADLYRADLYRAFLYCANLQGADVDFSAWPLWCGSFDVKCDIRLMRQLAYHFCRLGCKDSEVKAAQNALIKLANKFHRVEECGVLKPKQIKKTKTNEVRRKGKVNK